MTRFASLAILVTALLVTALAALPVVASFDGTLLAAIEWLATVTAIADRFINMEFALTLAALTLTIETALVAWRLGKLVYELIARL